MSVRRSVTRGSVRAMALGEFDDVVTTGSEVRALYRMPIDVVVQKKLPSRDQHARAGIEWAPLCSRVPPLLTESATSRPGVVRRSELWDPQTEPDRSALPSLGCIVRDQNAARAEPVHDDHGHQRRLRRTSLLSSSRTLSS